MRHQHHKFIIRTTALLLLLTAWLPGSVLAVEALQVDLHTPSSLVFLSRPQQQHLYEKTAGLFSTCNQLDTITGKDIPVADEKQALNKLQQGNYLAISFGAKAATFPILDRLQTVETMYVGIRDDGLPSIITINKGDIQLYAKCQGYVAIRNFSCDTVLAELLGFKIDQQAYRDFAP